MVALNVVKGRDRYPRSVGSKCFARGRTTCVLLLVAAQLAFGQQGANDRSADTYRSGAAGATPDVSGIAEKIVTAFSDGDLEALASMYADSVDYLDSGRISSADVRSQIAKYFARWPIRHWELTGPVKVQPTGASLQRVVFSAHYDVSNPDSNRHSAGIARETLVVTSDATGAMKITSHQEKTSSSSGSNNKWNQGRSERPRIYDGKPVALLPPSPESTPAQLAFGQQTVNDRSVGIYRGECSLKSEPVILELDISERTGAASWRGNLLITSKESGKPIGTFVVRGDGRNFYEERSRRDRSPRPEPMREFTFRTLDYSETLDGQLSLHIREERQSTNLTGTLTIRSRKSNNGANAAPATVILKRSESTSESASETKDGAAETINQAEIMGVYDGTYTADKRQFSLELNVTREGGSNALSGVFTFFAGATARQPLGTYKLKGEFEPSSNKFKFVPDGSAPLSAAFRPERFDGLFDPAKGTLQGEIGERKGSFALSRNEQKTKELQTKAANQARRLTEGPVALAAARTDDERRFVITRWFRRLKQEYPDLDLRHTVLDKIYPKVLNLFGDDDFIPVFGKPFDAMNTDDRTYVGRSFIELFNGKETRELLDGFGDFLSGPFRHEQGSFSYNDVMPQLAFRRGVHNKWRAAIERLKTLPSTWEGYEQIASLRNEGEKDFADLWPSQLKQFLAEVDSAKHRVAEGAFKDRIAAAIPKAVQHRDAAELHKGLTDVKELVTMVSEQARSSTDADVDTALTTLIQIDEQQHPVSGTGLAAVAAGNTWYNRLSNDYGFARDRLPYQKAVERLASSRPADLLAAAPAIIAEISQQYGSDMKSTREKYLGVPGDANTDAARQIDNAITERQVALNREKVLEMFSPNERKWVQADGKIVLPNPVPPPNEDDVRIAIARVLEGRGAKRVSPYDVQWRDVIGSELGMYIRVKINRVQITSCSPVENGYKVGYILDATCLPPPSLSYGGDLGDGAVVLAEAFREQLAPEGGCRDDFELTSNGWSSPTLHRRSIISGRPY